MPLRTLCAGKRRMSLLREKFSKMLPTISGR